MAEMLLDLCITLVSPPPGTAQEVIATIELRCGQLGLYYTGDLLKDLFTSRERENIRWYLEEYVKWPYEQFLERGQKIEAALPEFGKRLYSAICASPGAMGIIQAWRLLPDVQQRQISIVSDVSRALSLPWELLHDEQGFLVLRSRRPISLIRRLPQHELSAFPTSFEPPLRILLVTARPDNTDFVDPRSIARELLDEMQQQINTGTIALEILRPPTLPALRDRLSDPDQPSVQVLHFDGHGILSPTKNGQGMLAFEDEHGQMDLVKAEDMAQVLQGSEVKLAVLTACQSAMSNADDALSSVAAQLIRSGIDAVMAMSASVLVITATRYAEALYRALAAGIPTSVAHERARQALHDNPRRDIHHRRQDDEGTIVTMRDWWLPHYYQHRQVVLQPMKSTRKGKRASRRKSPPLNEHFPVAPRYGFSGRSRELLRIERALLQKKLVVIHGFGGMGKTALAREVSEWLTRTHMYDGACFLSFEQGGDASSVLSTLGSYLSVYNGSYNPGEIRAALARLQPILQTKKILLVADNLESILPQGETLLEPADRAQLWDVLLGLARMGAGIILTSRDISFGDGRLAQGQHTYYLSLQGLQPDDAYTLASHVLNDLGIEGTHAPYAELRALLVQLDHHPLAIQLVLPALRGHTLASVQSDFACLLPIFADDTITGRNRALLASLDYSLSRLSQKHRVLLPRLVLFEGGAMEDNLLAITQIPQEIWATLRPDLEQAALLVAEPVHEAINVPFLHFHPVLLPFLRQQAVVDGSEIELAQSQRYAQRYAALAEYFEHEISQDPGLVYTLVRHELPNLLTALTLLLDAGNLEIAFSMGANLTKFLNNLGLIRKRDSLRQRMEQALTTTSTLEELTQPAYLQEIGRAQDERNSGEVQAAFARLTQLLSRIQALPEGTNVGSASFPHCRTLQELGDCLRDMGQYMAALEQFRTAIAILDTLQVQMPEDRNMRIIHADLLNGIGTVLGLQGHYTQAQSYHEQAFQEQRDIHDVTNETATLGQLGTLALLQQDYAQACSYYQQALQRFQTIRDPIREAQSWHQLGVVAEEQHNWSEAERCFRESWTLKERIGDAAGVAKTFNQLAAIAADSGRPDEAESWYKGALERILQVEPGGVDHAMYLNNLASLLINEVQTGRAEQTRLIEAHDYLEQAKYIREQSGVSTDIWNTYSLLAQIAELEKQPEVARDYRRRECESYAAFAGNRYQIDQQLATLIHTIVEATHGNTQDQAELSAVFPILEQQGLRISEGIRCIWQGERNWQALLTDRLSRKEALLLLRVLETLASLETPA